MKRRSRWIQDELEELHGLRRYVTQSARELVEQACHAAAAGSRDAFERLRAENEELKKALAELQDVVAAQRSTLDALAPRGLLPRLRRMFPRAVPRGPEAGP
jgi:predicted translin family RNA/ssDNA-binding protein